MIVLWPLLWPLLWRLAVLACALGVVGFIGLALYFDSFTCFPIQPEGLDFR